MKRLILMLFLFLTITTNCYSQHCDVAVDGNAICDFSITDWNGLTSAPSVSSTNEGRIYFDTSDGKFKCSEDGGAYANCVGGSTLWNNIGDPDAAGSISFDDNETATYTSAEDTGAFFHITLTDDDLSGITTALKISHADNDDNNGIFLELFDDSAGDNDSVFKIGNGGRMWIGDIANNYTMPIADGTANWVLTTNGAGAADWAASGAGATELDGLSDVITSEHTAGNILIGFGAYGFYSRAMTGDASLSGAGVISVTDLSISGEAQGEILYHDGSGWESLGVGTSGQHLETQGAGSNPQWATPVTSLSGLSDVNTSDDTSGYVLAADGSGFDGRALVDNDVPDTITIDVADTATALATARTIAGTSFDGTANIDIPLDGLSDVTTSDDTSGYILIADGSGYDGTAVSGDVTIAAGGATTIGVNKVQTDEIDLSIDPVWTGSHDYGSALLEIPNGSDPDVDTVGQVSIDTDVYAVRTYDLGLTTQIIIANKQVTITVTIVDPLDLTEADTLPIWKNRTGFTFNITAIHSDSDTDDVDYTLKEAAYTNYTALTTIEAIAIDTNGTAVFYDDITSGIDHTEIENTNVILFDNNATDDPGYLSFTIIGYLAAE